MKSKRLETRDPVKRDPLPQAGESTQNKLSDLFSDTVVFWMLSVTILLGITISTWAIWIRQQPIHPGFITVLTVGIGMIGAWKIFGAIKSAQPLRLGMRGELAVAEEVNRLVAHGYRVFHDIPGDGFNVDHVAIGPGGVFVIETKAASKPISGDARITYDGVNVLVNGFRPDRDPVKQARACRDHIFGILEKCTGNRPQGRAVVVYPGWWVDRQPHGVEVWVLNPIAFSKFVLKNDAVLTPTEIGNYAMSIEAYVRSQPM